MSKQRQKGTQFESDLLPYLQIIYPDAWRTGSNHSTPWGKADFANTGNLSIEAKGWDTLEQAMTVGTKQSRETAIATHRLPLLIVKRKYKPIEQAFVVQPLWAWIDSHDMEGRA